MKKYAIKNPRFPHKIKVYRITCDAFTDESVEEVLYEGDARNFFNTTTDGDSKMVTNLRKSAIPIPNEMVEDVILAGDYVDAWKGKNNEIHEYGIVTDFKPANFGTEIFWKYGRN